MQWRSWVKGKVPPLVWRDRRIEEQRRTIAGLRTTLRAAQEALDAPAPTTEGRPSFRRELLETRRRPEFAEAIDPDGHLPTLQLSQKIRNYRLAASHGVPVPEVLASWSSIGEIDLDALPDRFVLKSDGGASGDGVFPLERLATGRYRWLAEGQECSGAEILDLMRSRGLRARPPFFAEELIDGAAPGALPVDVKVYAFHGRVGQVLLRSLEVVGGRRRVSWNYVDSAGTTIDVGLRDRRIDPGIPVPAELPEMVEIARHLSRAVGLALCRVDMYGGPRGVLLGEITRAPGGSQDYGAEHDEYMGRLFADARERLELDVLGGRPPGVVHGGHRAVNHYPAGHPSWQDEAGWAVRSAPCERWCVPPGGDVA